MNNRKLILLLIFISQSIFPAKAQSFLTPDLTFGTGGFIHNDSAFAYCATTDASGNYYVGGTSAYSASADCAITKMLPNGQADPTFGFNGITYFDLGFPQQHINDLAVQPDGKIVFVGGLLAPSNWNAFIGRVTPDGQLDTSFNGTGYSIIDVNAQYDDFYSVAIKQNGKIVVGGTTCFGNSGDYKFAAWCFNSNGSPDASFYMNGLYRHVTNGSVSKVLLDGNNIVLGGLLESPDYDYCIMRLDQWGFPDPSFGTSGTFLYPKSGNNFIENMIIDGSNYIAVTSSYVGSPLSNDMNPQIFGVSYYGALITSWFGGGFYTFNQPGYSVMPASIIKSGNSVIVAGVGFNTGYFGNTAQYNGVFYQVNILTGALNTNNGVNGLVTYGISGVYERINYVNAEASGQIVFIGNEGSYGNFISKYVYSSVGFEELESNNLVIYPNPASDKITVQIDDENCESIEIRDYLGKLYLSTSIRKGNNEIVLKDLRSGNYILNFLDKSGVNHYSRKIIVQ